MSKSKSLPAGESWEDRFDKLGFDMSLYRITHINDDGSADSKFCGDFVKDFISKELQNQREELIKEIKKQAQQFNHSEFCTAKGKQFRKCLICILEKL